MPKNGKKDNKTEKKPRKSETLKKPKKKRKNQNSRGVEKNFN